MAVPLCDWAHAHLQGSAWVCAAVLDRLPFAAPIMHLQGAGPLMQACILRAKACLSTTAAHLSASRMPVVLHAKQFTSARCILSAATVLCVQAIRYPWYAATLLNDCPKWLTWLRYTAFIPLYPAGVVAEMILLYVSAQGLWFTSSACVVFPGSRGKNT